MYARLARLSARIGARSPDPRVTAFALRATARSLSRTPRGQAAAAELAADPTWEVRYVAALVLGEHWRSSASPREVVLRLARDEHPLVRAALARALAATGTPVEDFASLDPACARIARHAQLRIAWEAREAAR